MSTEKALPKDQGSKISTSEFTFPLYGVAQDAFKTDELENMARGRKSGVHTFSLKNEAGEHEPKEARIAVYRKETGKLGVKFFEKQAAFTLKEEISGVQYTPQERSSLEKGNAILKTGLQSPEKDGTTYNAWLQIDKDLNRLEVQGEKRFPLPDTLLGKDLKSLHEAMRTTGEARVEGLVSKDGKHEFDATLKVNLVKGGFDFADSKNKGLEREMTQVKAEPVKEEAAKVAIAEEEEEKPAKKSKGVKM